MRHSISVMILIFVLIGCTPSPATQEFIDNLQETEKSLELLLNNIDTDFHNYDVDYSPNRIFNSITITESQVKGMALKEDAIKEESISAENLIVAYNTQKEKANVEGLNEQQKTIVSKIDNRKTAFFANQNKIKNCINHMNTYRKFIDLARVNIINTEDFETKQNLITNEIESQDYDPALNDIDRLKQIVIDIKKNGKERNNLGIINLPTTIIDSWDFYYDSLDELQKYVEFLKEGDIESAEAQYATYSQAFTKVIQSGQGESLNANLNTIDNWYQEKIGICLNSFGNRNY